MNKTSRQNLIPLALLLALSGLAFLPLVNQFGYYRDDWNLIYAGHTLGAAKFIDIYSIDRPLIGYLFAGIYSAFGDYALPYCLAAYSLRLLGAFGFFWLFRQLWPASPMAGFAISTLFLLYPGFLQLPNGIQFQPHLLNMALSVFSIALTVRALQAQGLFARIGFTLLSVLLGLWSMLMMEYYIGLEGARLAVIAYVVNRSRVDIPVSRLRRTLLASIPYLVAVAAFLYWRAFIFVGERPATDLQGMLASLAASPVYRLLDMAADLIRDFFDVVVLAWAVPPYQYISAARLRDFWLSLGLGLVAGVVFLLGWWRLHKLTNRPAEASETPDEEEAWEVPAMLLGAVSALFAGLPIVFANREVSYILSYDRFSLPGSFGAAFLIGGGLFRFFKGRWRTSALALLVVVAVMTHYNSAMGFALHWKTARSFWWQLAWRAPQIERGTVLLVSMPSALEEDYEIWGPANLIYYPYPGELGLTSEVLNTGTLQDLIMGDVSARTMRTINVERDYSRTLLLTMATRQSCLRAVDGSQVELSQFELDRVLLAAPYSHIERINPTAVQPVPPPAVFGLEPEHTWCYYFEKADLARQQGNWQEATRLGDEARSRGLHPYDWGEWLPILESYARTNQEEKARSLVPIIKEQPFVRFRFCENLAKKQTLPERALADTDGDRLLLEILCD